MLKTAAVSNHQKNSTYIIGLGNPGLSYKLTRHNVGFMLIDLIANHFDFPEFSKKFDGYISSGDIHNHKIVLFKPNTFINNSGIPLSKLSSFYKIPNEDIIVVHDDVELNFGRTKVKIGGGDGGHNGLKSIDQYCGKKYWRLRIGVDRPEVGDLSSYVLSKFTAEEDIVPTLQKIIKNFPLLLGEDKNLFIQNYHNT